MPPRSISESWMLRRRGPKGSKQATSDEVPHYHTMKFSILLFIPMIAYGQPAPSPYAGEQNRAIKALSESDTANLMHGHGMGLAKAAELNAYPGPRHVLDLANELKLSADQRASLEKIVAEMQAHAIRLGKTIVDREKELDELFVSKRATEDKVTSLTAEIGRLQGELRATHLNAHVATERILSSSQVQEYVEVRGYGAAR